MPRNHFAQPSIAGTSTFAFMARRDSTVAAEPVAATRGLGFMVQAGVQFLNTDIVVLGIFVIALIAFSHEVGLRAIQGRLVPWQGKS